MLEKRALQILVGIACIVPLGAGGAGMLFGPWMIDAPPLRLDSHFRYLSGLLFAIGIGFATTIPRIELREARFQLLTGLVLIGGLGRAISLLDAGTPSSSMIAALGMELAVTPLLALWQRRVARCSRL